MAESKYAKYIITKAKPPRTRPPRPPAGERSGEIVAVVDDEVIKGAFYLNCALIWKASGGGSPPNSHSHDWD